MRIEEMIGKTVTNIYSLVKMEVGGLDTGECFVELDDKYVIDIPFGQSDDIGLKEINPKAENLFADLTDIPVYHVNKDKKTIGDLQKFSQLNNCTRIGNKITNNETTIEYTEVENLPEFPIQEIGISLLNEQRFRVEKISENLFLKINGKKANFIFQNN